MEESFDLQEYLAEGIERLVAEVLKNSRGGAEPCPFSPYSDCNVRNGSLKDALNSPLFMALQSGDILLDDHEGGCVLYEKRELVESLLAGAGKTE